MMVANGNIKEISAFVPDKVRKTADNPHFDKKDLFVFQKTTGIKQIHVSDRDPYILGVNACAPLRKKNIDVLIYVSQTEDVVIPGRSNTIASLLKMNCATLDLLGACNGFTQGLMTAFALTSVGQRVLLVFADVMTKIMHPEDRNSLMFGDAAVAMVVEPHDNTAGFHSMCDGSRYDLVVKRGDYLKMDGEGVFDFAMGDVFEFVKYYGDFDYYVFHQSNEFILKQLKRKMDIRDDQLIVNIQDYGNTSAVSIPLAMVTGKPTGNVFTCGYGAGLNWGLCMLYYQPEKVYYNEG